MNKISIYKGTVWYFITCSNIIQPYNDFLCFATDKGSDRCFQSYNTRGDHYGNCGSNGNSFVPCSDRYKHKQSLIVYYYYNSEYRKYVIAYNCI